MNIKELKNEYPTQLANYAKRNSPISHKGWHGTIKLTENIILHNISVVLMCVGVYSLKTTEIELEEVANIYSTSFNKSVCEMTFML
jgi:hypothetical protein